ncbi:MAG: bi-domain-containing oxidoreductase [Planctomycetota bacterium]|jgi:polar amino acid transport system substrate-binding protein
MHQIQQNWRSGELGVVEVPIPALRPGGVLVANAYSLISSGTERNTVATARQSLLGKARSRPDLVKRVLRVARREGLLETCRMVRNRLDTPIPLGYSSAGYVVAVAEDVDALRVGDPVACAGTGYASHAEVVFAPKHLVARVPEGVSLADAASTTLGAIALQGVRQAAVALGDRVAVVGLGLLGQLTVQILKAAGCRVLATDLAADLVERARQAGADLALERDAGVEDAAELFGEGWGVDRVILTASTKSNDPVELAGRICRERGTVVVVGNIRLDVPRDLYYRKELNLKLSRSYGPGRYDPRYEERGIDYPLPYVRWTEHRNLAAFLDLLAERKLDPGLLTTHRFDLDRAEEAYRLVTDGNGERCVGILLRYQAARSGPEGIARRVGAPAPVPRVGEVGISFIGAGSFARNFLLPRLKQMPGVALRRVVTTTGLSARTAARKFGFAEGATEVEAALADAGTRALFIATRHDSHADLVCRGLRAGKYVFCEKPLALTPEQLAEVRAAATAAGGGHLMVGFNRRFAPAAVAARAACTHHRGPVVCNYRVNAGPLPRDHWLHDPVLGGGRILGEACHFVDFVCFLTEERIGRVFGARLRDGDDVAITLELRGGSLATIHYLTNGDRGLAKEWIEIFGGGRVVQIADFTGATLFAHQRRSRLRQRGKGRGYAEELAAFVDAARGGGPLPASEEDAFHVTEACFAVLESLRSGEPVALPRSDAVSPHTEDEDGRSR